MAGRKKAISKTAEKLAKALTFVGHGVEEGGETWKAHGRIINGYLVTFNGSLSVGHPVEEELTVCPHIPNWIAAINKAGKTLAMAQNDKGNLQINGENIRAIVPCLKPEDMPPIMPDMKIAEVNDALKDGLKALLPLCSEDGDRVHEISILVRANSMVATNGTLIFEYWHGIDLPTFAILKASAKAITSVAEKLEGFGWNGRSTVTFWFEGGAFMQMPMAAGEWPAVDHILNAPGDPADLHPGFFDGIEAVASFSADGAVHFDTDKIRSGYSNYGPDGPVYGATYDVPGMQKGHTFGVRLLKLIKPVCAKLDYWTNEDRGIFFGPVANGEDFPRVRGVIMKMRKTGN